MNSYHFTTIIYEHMKNDPRNGILTIAKFLGEEYVSKLLENDEYLLKLVLSRSSVNFMKSELKFNFLVRKGVIGDWKNHFNSSQSKLVDDKFYNTFKGTDILNLWEHYIKW